MIWLRTGLSSAIFLAVFTSAALAHSAERGFVMLLPTGWIMTGGALVVAVSGLVIATLPSGRLESLAQCSLRLGHLPRFNRNMVSVFSFVIVSALLAIGFFGAQDPLKNLLPLMVWTGFWVVIVLLHPIFGNLWVALNPLAWLMLFCKGRMAYPARWSYWPGFLIFAAFSWFQLIDPAPEDPQRLALAVSIYVLATSLACFVFGAETWFERGDPFCVILRFMAQLAPLTFDDKGKLVIRLPALNITQIRELPISAASLVVLTLSMISFDALAASFWWLSRVGINPLEFPGRTALVAVNSAGLFLFFFAFMLAIGVALKAGLLLSRSDLRLEKLFGLYALALLPISVAFHLSHYLTQLLVNGQYLIASLNDPFEKDWALLGLDQIHVTTSFLNTAHGAWTIYAIQTLVIVIGHMIAVLASHVITLQHVTTRETALLLEFPLAIVMVFFTGFGLWCLSTPAVM